MNEEAKSGICPDCGKRLRALADESLCCDCGWYEGREDEEWWQEMEDEEDEP